MANAFAEFLTEVKSPTINTVKQREKTEAEYFVQAEYTVKSDFMRCEINKATKLEEKYSLAIKLISELTGDPLFYKRNIETIRNP